MRPYILVLGCLAGLAACDKVGGKASLAEPAAAAIVPIEAPSSANQAAADFVAKALGEDQYEIEASAIVAKRGASPAVRAFAESMVRDHKAAANALKLAVAKSHESLPMPTQLPDHWQAMIDLLGRGRPSDFDKTYMEQQVEAQEEAVSFATAYGATGAVPAIRAAAADLAPLARVQLDKARSIQDALNKAS